MDTNGCPMCAGDGHFLGSLGKLDWFRCRNCGWEYNRGESNSAPVLVADLTDADDGYPGK